jgi:glycosyltransferase involved in cell wall biosynthesis
MRIGLITHLYPRFRGDYKGIFVADLARFLGERGHQIFVITPLWPGTVREEVMGSVKVYRFAYWSWHQGKRLGELKSFSPLILGSLLLSGIRESVKLAREHNLDLFHSYWVVPGGTIAVVAGWLTDRPAVATAAGSDLNQAASQLIAGLLVRITLKHIRSMMAPGSQLARRAIELGMPRQRVQPLMGHSGIDLDHFSPEGAERSFSSILYVGNLAPPKRVDTILRAMPEVVERVPSARLWLVGDGELHKELEILAAELEISHRVEFLGARPHDEMPDWMRQAQMLVHCSDHEGLPVAIMEALGCGLPVVAANVGGISDLVKEGETGFLLSPDDVAGFSDRLVRLVSQPELASKLGRNARAFAEANLAKERVLDSVEAIYASAIQHG